MWRLAGGESSICRADQVLALLSVRSGVDALLQALAWPAGSEIIISAITIPHMLDIFRRHRLVTVPVDINTHTLAIDSEEVCRAVTPRTRAVFVAHLFGSRMPLDAVALVAERHDLLLIEDCAQANDGSGYQGHPSSAVTMFSFGPIKRQTAMGGAVFRFQDPKLALRVRGIQAAYPSQSRWEYAQRVLSMMMVKAIVSRFLFNTFVAACRWSGRGHDQQIGGAVRSFSGSDLFSRLRRQPSVPLLKTLARRLQQPPRQTVARRVAMVDAMIREFPKLVRPGAGAEHHSHWLVPMLNACPEQMVRQLWDAGYDATQGASNLVAVPPAGGRAHAANAERLMAEILYLPFSPSATEAQIQQMARCIREQSRKN